MRSKQAADAAIGTDHTSMAAIHTSVKNASDLADAQAMSRAEALSVLRGEGTLLMDRIAPREIALRLLKDGIVTTRHRLARVQAHMQAITRDLLPSVTNRLVSN